MIASVGNTRQKLEKKHPLPVELKNKEIIEFHMYEQGFDETLQSQYIQGMVSWQKNTTLH